MAKKPNMSRASRLADALSLISDGCTAIEELRDEIEEWRSNLEGTNLENTQKYLDLEECWDALDSLIVDFQSVCYDGEDIEFPTAFS